MNVETESRILILDADEMSYLSGVAREHDVAVEEIPQVGIEPVATVSLCIIGAVSAVATVAYLVDSRRGGQIIDLRHGAPKAIYRSPDLVYGLIVIITATGLVRVEVKEPKGLFGQASELVTGVAGELIGQEGSVVQRALENAIPADVASVTLESQADAQLPGS
ncbi:hypothetical protein GCU56_18820 [Geodermatophilus sabuli]|uniref:Uncharacterized protein n=1 Tax=Geodermatophilus sabuli TaxID=1564158 RepID=A0A7K3W516_9ACTN|nr:hypothetical protein [Geodermatophilus sabuli]NEK59912.1 hypothetical protein [Geodermatophilus sabuli]